MREEIERDISRLYKSRNPNADYYAGLVVLNLISIALRFYVSIFDERVATEGHPYNYTRTSRINCRGGPPWPPVSVQKPTSRPFFIEPPIY